MKYCSTRKHFARLCSGAALDIDVVYHVDNPDFNFCMDVPETHINDDRRGVR